ncbi:MAG: heme ABC transporter ATP-binding protein [Actinomycetota bacterium]
MIRLAAPAAPTRVEAGARLLRARDLTVVRAGRSILDGVDIEVRAGELVALVGPNGSGKSTTLGVLSGDIAADGGSVELGDGPAGAFDSVESALRRAVLQQRNAVTFPFRVGDVVSMGRAPWRGVAGTTAAADREIVATAMSSLDVAGFAGRPYPVLSGGEQARVSLARVLAQTTQLLLLDEPTAALDIHHQERVFAVLRHRAQQGDGILLVVHDLQAAAAHADRVVVLDAGRVAAEGPVDSTMTAEMLTGVYGHDIRVITEPDSGELVILPRRLDPFS